MNLFLIILWIIGVTVFSTIATYVAKKQQTPNAIIGLYVGVIIISNIIAYKIAAFNLGFMEIYAPGAVIIFSLTFLLTDIVNEKFGRKETHKMIFIAFIAQVAVAFFVWLSLSLDPAPFFTDSEAFTRIIGFAPRIMLASWITFLVSENLDAYIFDWFKNLTKGKHLWLRNAFSSIPAMAVDSALFVAIAFSGILPLWPLILGQLIIKWLSAIIAIPFMYANRAILYRK